ncbi:sporulation-delaying protein SdpB family protein [Streptomyces sp. NPDC052042]|uniref:sporulation-delaying protein SdpB family protein n=1 Tax=Streptomyces sp. NPDC052042 TaxID=3365683 RepID=UPI0037D381E6
MPVKSFPSPWTSVYGLARTLVALGTSGTLLWSGSDTLFRPGVGRDDPVGCEGPRAIGLFCHIPEQQLDVGRLVCVAVLLVIASGWRPRWTALPHAWITYSVWANIAIPDGGDQIACNLSILLALAALGDPRRWHWDGPPEERPGPARPQVTAFVCCSALVMARLQMSFLYFQACVAKLPHTEWADGTAMWYWSNNLAFGAPGWLDPVVELAVGHPLGVAALTWAPLFIEFGLALVLLLPQRLRWYLLAAGVLFHLSIALMMGLWSFAFAMWAGLVVLCLPLGAHLRLGPSPELPTAEDPTHEPTQKPALRTTADADTDPPSRPADFAAQH